jgi:hypothetical protein
VVAPGLEARADEVLGVSAPDIRRVLRPLARSLGDAPPSHVLAMARALLPTEVHEARQVAFESPDRWWRTPQR